MADPYRYFRIEGRELADELATGLSTLARAAAAPDVVGALLRHTHTLKGAARVVGATEIADLAHALEELLEPYRGSTEPVPEDRVADLQALGDEISDRVDGLGSGTETETDQIEDAASLASASTRGAADRATRTAADGRLAEALAQVLTEPEVAVPHTGAGGSVPGQREAGLPSSVIGWTGDAPIGRPAPAPAAPAPAHTAAPAAPAHAPAPAPAPAAEPEPAAAGPSATARASLAEIEAVIRGVGQARAQLVAMRQNGNRLAEVRSGLYEDPGPTRRGLLRKIAKLEHEVEQVQRELNGSVDRLERELSQVHDVAERLRLVPVASIVADLERAARDVASTLGKRVLVDVVGAELRLDAPVLAAAQDALRQIVRNAVAHGIESPQDRVAAGKPLAGRVRVEVSQRAGQIVFSCTDDGRGVDVAAVRQELARRAAGGGPVEEIAGLDDAQVLDRLLLGGVSTAPVVSEVAGRGIGMDVVRDAVQRLGGRLSIRTAGGAGTTIDLASPLSLAAQELVLLDAGDLVALPLAAVTEVVRYPTGEITSRPQGETIEHRGQVLPFLPLPAVLGESGTTSRSLPAWSVLIVGGAGIGVRRVVGTSGAAIRALPRLAPVPDLVAGVWLDAGGRPRLVLDPAALADRAGRHRGAAPVAAEPTRPILVVDDSLTTRMLEASILESAGYDVELASCAEEGLAMAAAKPYALALVDVEMPGLDGFAFVEQTRIRPELRSMPCILVTSRASAQDQARGVAAGAFGHVDKGRFSQGELLALITAALAG